MKNYQKMFDIEFSLFYIISPSFLQGCGFQVTAGRYSITQLYLFNELRRFC